MANSSNKIKAESIAPIANREQAEIAIQRIATLQQELARHQANITDQVNKLKTEGQTKAIPINEEISAVFKSVHVYAEANRDELCVGKTKTVKLGAGDMGWRKNPGKVSIRGEEGVIEALRALGFNEAIRSKDTIAKDVILNDQDKYKVVKGITIKATEDFFVKPSETKLEQVEVIK